MKATVFLLLSLFGTRVVAGDEEKRPWSNKSELSGVRTSGNSESSSLGFKNTYKLDLNDNAFQADLGVVHAKSNDEVVVEHYSFHLKNDRKINEKTYWYASTGWTRDEIAGVKSAIVIGSGIGRKWVKTKKRKFSTDLGFGYVLREYVIEPEDFEDAYLTGQLGFTYFQKVTETSEYEQQMEMNKGLEGEKALEAEWEHTFSVAVSKTISLKIGYRLNYNSEPAFKDATLTTKLDDLDTTFTTSLVLNF